MILSDFQSSFFNWIRFVRPGRLVGFVGLVFVLALSQATAQETVDWRGKRMALERQFGDELQEIMAWCRENGIPQQVEQTVRLYQNRDPGRQYIFLPTPQSMPQPGENVPAILRQWLGKINKAKIRHAENIFDLAKKAADWKSEGVAFQMLHDVIHFNRDHADVRKILGHRKKNDGWRVVSDKLRVSKSRKDHDLVKWQTKKYIVALTPHFRIESNASEERTRYLAEQLERSHLVWRQVFFEYWASPGTLKRWLAGSGSLRDSNKKFRVVFFKDREEYLRQMTPLVRGIEVSEGYYNKDRRCSFFYDGSKRVEDTWRHELTHQMFRESGGSRGESLETNFIWLDEGIATYFESLTDYGKYVTLGGFDSRRLQYSRIRNVLENFHVPIKELSELGRAELQQRQDMVRIYSEAAGLTDMLMNDDNGIYQERLVDFLQLMYKGRVKKGAFERIIGESFEDLDEQYRRYLRVDSDTVAKHMSRPESRTELSLPDADLQNSAYESIGQCVNLKWLDLSRNSVSSEQIKKLAKCKKLNQLILTECQFDPTTLAQLRIFPSLDELDLSGSSVQDNQLAGLRNQKSLKSISLTATNITDNGLMILASMPWLKSVNVAKSRCTAKGISALKSRLPNVEISN